MDKFKEKRVNTFNILDLLEKNNSLDCYEDRREFKEKRYRKLREKYEVNETNKNNARFLLSMLAVREVNDDWWPAPICGSLSVNSYGQLKPEEIINLIKISGGYTVLAHPNTVTNEKEILIQVLERLKNYGLFGIEVVNNKMKLSDTEYYQKLARNYESIETYGSNFHNPDCDKIGIEINSEDCEKIRESMVLRKKTMI